MTIPPKKHLPLLAAFLIVFSAIAWSSPDEAPRPVVIFTIDFCPSCLGAKKWFREQGIDFVELNIEQSTEAAERFREIGGRGIPLILVDGKRLEGFSPESFRDIRSARPQ